METFELLKQEINKTLENLHDFAKWKLIVVSALASTALGLLGSGKSLAPWLLVFVPYASAYIDLNCYQYLLRIFLIAKVLRSSQSASDPLLNEYEEQCEKYREQGFFSFGLFAQVGCSLVFSAVVLGFVVGRFRVDEAGLPNICPLLAIWLVGVLLIILCYWVFVRKRRLLDSTERTKRHEKHGVSH